MIQQACEGLGDDLLTRDELTTIFEAILDGPNRDSFRQFAGEAYTEELFQQRRRYFHRKQLRPFKSVLFGEYQDYFSELEEDTGTDIADADYRSVREGRSGMVSRRSPRQIEELAGLSDEELLDYINEWDDEHSDDNDWLVEVTIEALSEAFETCFREVAIPNTNRLAFWLTNRDRIQRPIYVRAMLNAMRAQIGEQDFDCLDLWLETCEWVLSHPDGKREQDFRPADRLRGNPHWGESRRAVEDLVGDLMKTCHDNQIVLPPSALARLPHILDMLCTQYDWLLDENQRVLADRDDWMSEGINNTRSRALQDLVRFGMLLCRDDPQADIPTITATLDKRLDPETEYPLTLAERAILGTVYELMIALDEAWAIKNRLAFFPRDDLNVWATAFGAFLRFHRPYRRYFEILEEDFEFAVEHLPALAERQPPRGESIDALGRVLFRYYSIEQYPLQGDASPIDRYYQMTDHRREHWAKLFNHVGLLLYRTELELEPYLEDRFKDFFEWRLQAGDPAELAECGFWLRATCLDAGWRLNAFSRILDVLQGEAFPARLDWGSLAEMLPAHTELVVACFGKIVAGCRSEAVYIRPEPARRILNAGLASENEVVQQEAERAREILLNSGRFNISMLED